MLFSSITTPATLSRLAALGRQEDLLRILGTGPASVSRYVERDL
jgi:hypothetical protein